MENSLEAEQEALVNRLWSKVSAQAYFALFSIICFVIAFYLLLFQMNKIEEEKRQLQEQLQLPPSTPQSPSCSMSGTSVGQSVSGAAGTEPSTSASVASRSSGDANSKRHTDLLHAEVARLKRKLNRVEKEHADRMHGMASEEQQLREENCRLNRKLSNEYERRKHLCGTESDTSLDIDDADRMGARERHQSADASGLIAGTSGGTASAAVPMSPVYSIPASPARVFQAPSPIPMPASGSNTHPPPSPMDTGSIRSESPITMAELPPPAAPAAPDVGPTTRKTPRPSGPPA